MQRQLSSKKSVKVGEKDFSEKYLTFLEYVTTGISHKQGFEE
jgi:hypothetical protein